MRECTKNLLTKYELKRLKYDFMGYNFKSNNELSFHHLIIPRTNPPLISTNKGYYEWNGVILVQRSSHEYLHVIESFDLDRYYAITSEMLDEKIKGYICWDNIKIIDDILNSFEKEYEGRVYQGNGKSILKDCYVKRLVKTNMRH